MRETLPAPIGQPLVDSKKPTLKNYEMNTKYNFFVILLLTSNIIFGQNEINYQNLKIDTHDINFRNLKIKEIEQIRTYRDSIKTNGNLEYVITYDSLSRVSSVLFEFESEYSNNEFVNKLETNPTQIEFHNSKEKLYVSYNLNDSTYYNYFE